MSRIGCRPAWPQDTQAADSQSATKPGVCSPVRPTDVGVRAASGRCRSALVDNAVGDQLLDVADPLVARPLELLQGQLLRRYAA